MRYKKHNTVNVFGVNIVRCPVSGETECKVTKMISDCGILPSLMWGDSFSGQGIFSTRVDTIDKHAHIKRHIDRELERYNNASQSLIT